MMRSATKLRWGGVLSGVLLILLIGFAAPVSTGFGPWMNESVRGLDADQPDLDGTIVETDYDVTYRYLDEDGEEHIVDVTGAGLDAAGVTAGVFDAELRVLGVDLSAPVLTTDPEYKTTADFDHYVTIELPEKANVLWDETISVWCAGFVLERGAAPVDADNYTVPQDYKFQIGSGKEVLYSVTVAGDDTAGLTEGDADTNKVGTCLDREDVANSDPEFGATLEVEDIQAFLNDAYVQKDADKPTALWIKVYGPRASNADEGGDAFDVALQFYNYGDVDHTAYNNVGMVQIFFGIGGILTAVFMTAAFSVPRGDLNGNVKRTRKGGY